MSEDRDWEGEAEAGGWNPDKEAVPEGKWVDAQTFVERGEKIAGVMRGKVEKLESQVQSLSASNAEFKKFTDSAMKRQRTDYEGQIKALQDTRTQAISEGDGEKWSQADNDLQELRSEPVVSNNALVDQWVATNTWYNSDEDMRAYADGIAATVAKDFQGQQYFNELTRRVQKTFPASFQKAPSPVEPGGSREGVKTKSYSSLPADAKAACERFVKDIPGFTKEQYLENYEWDA